MPPVECGSCAGGLEISPSFVALRSCSGERPVMVSHCSSFVCVFLSCGNKIM